MCTVDAAIRECKRILEAYYGARLKGLVLYGSVARGDADGESDIDLLVLLDSPFDFFAELWHVVELLDPAQLESARLISAKPAAFSEYERGTIQLYRNAQREGAAV
jgi:predicted nucleotidyltransferase